MSDHRFVLGIDWGNKEHTLCLVEAASKRRWKRVVAHSPEGAAEALAWVRELVPELSELAAGAERPDTAILEVLLEARVDCYAINPKQSERFRQFLAASGAKDDPRDAYTIALALATAPEAFRKLEVPAEVSIALREASRRLDWLNAELRANANRLGDALQRFAPQLLGVCKGADEPFFWDLLEAGADPGAAAKLRQSGVARLLRARGIRRVTAAGALALLRAPRMTLAPGAERAILATIASLLPLLRLTYELQEGAKADITRLTAAAGRDAEIIDSLIGVGAITVAIFLGEAPQAIKERDLESLRALTGVAPVTARSGGQVRTSMRRACNRRLRSACFHMARTACRDDPYARGLYESLRARGHGGARAYRSVADRLLARLISCLATDTIYSPPTPRQVSPADPSAP